MSTVTPHPTHTVRYASRTSAAVVAAIAAVASYAHMRGLALHYGQDPLIAALMPISVDGMLVVATTALVDGRRRKASAWLAFLTGVAASVTANVLAAPDSVTARAISAWPAVALLLVVEVLARSGRAVPAAPGPLAELVAVPAAVGPDGEDGLSTAARTVADELRTGGRRLTRDALAAALRAQGHTISTARAGVLARELA